MFGVDTCDQPGVNSLSGRQNGPLKVLILRVNETDAHVKNIRNTPVRRPHQTSLRLNPSVSKPVIAVISHKDQKTGHCVFVWFSVRKLPNKNYQ